MTMTRLTCPGVCLSSIPLIALIALAAGCGSDSKPPAGTPCVRNTDCNNPLSCSFGRCHVTCKETRDCPLGARCVKATEGNVCQLPEQKICSAATMCMAPLTCAIDLQCRNRCAADTECTPGQRCVDTVCAEPSEVMDGRLKVTDAGAPPATTDGALTPTPDAAAPADVPPGVDVPAAEVPVSVGLCGVPEMEPNDDKEHATPIAGNVTLPSCLGHSMDLDFYELTAPADPAGGYYQIAITDVGDFEPDLVAFTVSDNGMIDRLYADSVGQNLYAHLAAAPGQKYRLVVSAFFAGDKVPAKYTLKITYTKIDDAYEPNDSSDTPRPITLNTPITAYMFEGHRKARIVDEDVKDWYSVMAGAGPLTIKVESVPGNLTTMIELLDAAGDHAQMLGPNDGADTTMMHVVMTPGVYRIGVKPWGKAPDGFGKQDIAGALPSNYTKAYKLTVTQ